MSSQAHTQYTIRQYTLGSHYLLSELAPKYSKGEIDCYNKGINEIILSRDFFKNKILKNRFKISFLAFSADMAGRGYYAYIMGTMAIKDACAPLAQPGRVVGGR